MGYSVDEKAKGIAIMRQFGGMTVEAIREIEAALGRKPSKSTLSAWLNLAIEPSDRTEPNMPNRSERIKKAMVTEGDIQAAQAELAEKFRLAAHKYLDHALKENVVEDTKGPQAITASAVAVDKMRLLQGLPTEILEVIPSFMQKAQRAGKDPLQILIRAMEVLDADINTLH
ncbi:MAG: hypothetical protein K8L91_07885 [Anaerolineae bacterium]|nr:MAG: hypothetical protein F9K46_03470 [Anaerolineae bacterium]MBZ0316322.1 hypothetical protein [Anaerolineae bacterium]